MLVLHNISLHFLEQIVGEYELVEGFVGCMIYLVHISDPFTVTLIDEDNILTYAEHRVHVVGVDYGRDIVFVGDVGEELVNHD